MAVIVIVLDIADEKSTISVISKFKVLFRNSEDKVVLIHCRDEPDEGMLAFESAMVSDEHFKALKVKILKESEGILAPRSI